MTDKAGIVYVVDDDDAFRDSLCWLLESAGYRAAPFASAEAFLNHYAPHHAGCLVLDMRMPGMDGFELMEALQKRHATIPIIFVTGHGDIPMAVSAIKKGAMEFIEKPFNDEVFLELVRNALARNALLRAEQAQRTTAAARASTLTQREREIMERVVAGKANKTIANELDISVKTVEMHRAHMMEKMGADSIAELVRMALEIE